MFLMLETLETCGQTRKHCFRNKNVSEFVVVLLPGKQILSTQQCFPRWANMEKLIGNIIFLRQRFLGHTVDAIFALYDNLFDKTATL